MLSSRVRVLTLFLVVSCVGNTNGEVAAPTDACLPGASCANDATTRRPPPMADADGDVTADGGSRDASDTADGACVSHSESAPVYYEFLVDGTFAMGGAQWLIATNVLRSVFDEMARVDDPNVAAGLIVYGDTLEPRPTRAYPSPVDVPIARVNAAQNARLQARLGGNAWTSADVDATHGAFDAAGEFLPANVSARGGDRIVVRVDEGLFSSDRGFDDELIFIGRNEANVKTLVLGIGTPGDDVDPERLGRLALAGGTGKCDPNGASAADCYLQITPFKKTFAEVTKDVLAELARVRRKVVVCDGASDGGLPDFGGRVCAPDRTACSDVCSRLVSDPNHCGSCSNRCVQFAHGTSVCSSGACNLICKQGLQECATDCCVEPALRDLAAPRSALSTHGTFGNDGPPLLDAGDCADVSAFGRRAGAQWTPFHNAFARPAKVEVRVISEGNTSVTAAYLGAKPNLNDGRARASCVGVVNDSCSDRTATSCLVGTDSVIVPSGATLWVYTAGHTGLTFPTGDIDSAYRLVVDTLALL